MSNPRWSHGNSLIIQHFHPTDSLLAWIFPLSPPLFPALLLSKVHQQRAVLGTAVGHLCPVNFYPPCSLSAGASCLVFSRSCPGFVIAPSDFGFKGCLTGQAFLLMETLRKAPCGGGKGKDESRGCPRVCAACPGSVPGGNNSGAPGGMLSIAPCSASSVLGSSILTRPCNSKCSPKTKQHQQETKAEMLKISTSFNDGSWFSRR